MLAKGQRASTTITAHDLSKLLEIFTSKIIQKYPHSLSTFPLESIDALVSSISTNSTLPSVQNSQASKKAEPNIQSKTTYKEISLKSLEDLEETENNAKEPKGKARQAGLPPIRANSKEKMKTESIKMDDFMEFEFEEQDEGSHNVVHQAGVGDNSHGRLKKERKKSEDTGFFLDRGLKKLTQCKSGIEDPENSREKSKDNETSADENEKKLFYRGISCFFGQNDSQETLRSILKLPNPLQIVGPESVLGFLAPTSKKKSPASKVLMMLGLSHILGLLRQPTSHRFQAFYEKVNQKQFDFTKDFIFYVNMTEILNKLLDFKNIGAPFQTIVEFLSCANFNDEVFQNWLCCLAIELLTDSLKTEDLIEKEENQESNEEEKDKGRKEIIQKINDPGLLTQEKQKLKHKEIEMSLETLRGFYGFAPRVQKALVSNLDSMPINAEKPLTLVTIKGESVFLAGLFVLPSGPIDDRDPIEMIKSNINSRSRRSHKTRLSSNKKAPLSNEKEIQETNNIYEQVPSFKDLNGFDGQVYTISEREEQKNEANLSIGTKDWNPFGNTHAGHVKTEENEGHKGPMQGDLTWNVRLSNQPTKKVSLRGYQARLKGLCQAMDRDSRELKRLFYPSKKGNNQSKIQGLYKLAFHANELEGNFAVFDIILLYFSGQTRKMNLLKEQKEILTHKKTTCFSI